jgi:hypothetical protein
MKEQGN